MLISSFISLGFSKNMKRMIIILLEVIMKLVLEFAHLALYEGAQEHKDGDASAHYEVDEIPESKTTHFAQSHLLHLQTQSVPLITQLPLEAHQHHLQSCAREHIQRELQWLLLFIYLNTIITQCSCNS